MAIFADVVDEWKKAGTKEKLLIVGGGAAVIALALYLHSKSSGSQVQGTGTAGVGGSFQPSTGGSTGTTSGPPPGDGGLPPPSTGTGGLSGTVRAGGLFPTYDQQHGGVPVRSSPGGAILGYLPFTSGLQIFGSQQGPSNQSGDPANAGLGSTTWYQVFFNGVQAWVSAADVSLSPATQPTMPPGSVQPLSSARPKAQQPNHTMTVYASTRHSPSVIPTVSKQRA